MPNRYAAGRRFEWKRRDYYRSMGYLVIRSAGSKTPIDLVCVKTKGRVLLVQCKAVATQAAAAKLLREFKAQPPLPQEEPSGFTQVVDVYVKATRTVISESF